jgi:hypothetical protein
MKCVIILIACIIATCYGADTATGRFGYPATATNAVLGWVNITYTVSAAMISSTNTTEISLTLGAGSVSSATATVSYYWGYEGLPSIFLIKKSLTDGDKVVSFVVSNPAGNATGYGAGAYTFGGYIEACGLCSEFILTSEAQLYHGTSVQPFDAVQDPYTIDYSHASSTWGAPSARVTLTATTNIYVKMSSGVGRSDQKVVMVYTQNTVPTTTAEYTAATLKYPTGSPQEGDYSTGAVSLAAGTWYLSPYCHETVSSSVNCGYDFAVGIGSEPAAAAFSTPSFIVIALLSIFAILAL